MKPCSCESPCRKVSNGLISSGARPIPGTAIEMPRRWRHSRTGVRAALSSDDNAIRHAYLPNLLDHIVVGEVSIVLEVRADAALTMMVASRSPAVSTGTELLPDVVDWHARRDSNP